MITIVRARRRHTWTATPALLKWRSPDVGQSRVKLLHEYVGHDAGASDWAREWEYVDQG